MDLIGEEQGRLARAATWLQATRSELVGLLILLAGGLVLTGLVVWSALGRPLALPDRAAAEVGTPVVVHGDTHESDSGPNRLPDDPPDGPPDAGPVVVHVSGAVRRPGLVTLPPGARAGDAVAAAGGMLDDADPAQLNLARSLVDGEQVHVPREGESPPLADGDANPSSQGDGPRDGARIDLNRASAAELEALPGIGPTLAQRIVAHREQHGPFREPGDLRNVSGIGERRFQDLAPLVTVGG